MYETDQMEVFYIKKIVTILLSILIVMLLLAGCNEVSGSREPVEGGLVSDMPVIKDSSAETEPSEAEASSSTQQESGSQTVESMESLYIGEYLDYDNNEPNLEIAKGDDGKYIVQIGIYRLTSLSDGVGELTSEGMLFTATDAAGNPISGVITIDGQTATVTFTDSTWSLLENGTAFQYSKSSVTPDIWME